MADCRKCRWFVELERMSEGLRKRAEEWVQRYRPGEELLGWCRHYRRPVTYYIGRCPAYLPKPSLRQRRLTDYTNPLR